MLIQLNEIFSSRGLNIVAEFLQSHGDTGYVVIEVEGMSETADEILAGAARDTGHDQNAIALLTDRMVEEWA